MKVHIKAWNSLGTSREITWTLSCTLPWSSEWGYSLSNFFSFSVNQYFWTWLRGFSEVKSYFLVFKVSLLRSPGSINFPAGFGTRRETRDIKTRKITPRSCTWAVRWGGWSSWPHGYWGTWTVRPLYRLAKTRWSWLWMTTWLAVHYGAGLPDHFHWHDNHRLNHG